MEKWLKKKRLVLFLRTSLRITNRRTYDGIYAYGKRHGWQFQSVRVPSVIERDFAFSERDGKKRLAELLSFWKPDGCIAMGDVRNPFRRYVNFGDVPVVYCDIVPEAMPSGTNVISIDSAAVAKCAAKELLKLGFDSFAYVSYPQRLPWCETREKCFRKIIELNGKSFAAARLPARDAPCPAKREFDRWLSRLPKPLGIFAANDEVAEMVVDTCVRNGISVPCDVSVVGADNDELVCENAAVPVTSVVPDFMTAGQMAAQLLDELMEMPARSQVRYFGIDGIVRRESTRITDVFDSQIVKALEFIRRHACEGVKVPDVVKEMGCSRRYADMRFSKAVGWSVLKEIRRVKIDNVKERLRNTRQSLQSIADMSGFASCDDMRRTFRQFTGCSLSVWRRKQNEKGMTK